MHTFIVWLDSVSDAEPSRKVITAGNAYIAAKEFLRTRLSGTTLVGRTVCVQQDEATTVTGFNIELGAAYTLKEIEDK